jgi:hypothetical protein
MLEVAKSVDAVIPPDNLKLDPVALVKITLVEVRLVVLSEVVEILVDASKLVEVMSPVTLRDVPVALVKIILDVVILVRVEFPVEILVAVIVGTFNELVRVKLTEETLVTLTLVAVIFVVDKLLVLMVVDVKDPVVIPLEITIELPLALVNTAFWIVALLVLRELVLILVVARRLAVVILPDKFKELADALVKIILGMDALVAISCPDESTELKIALVDNRLLVVRLWVTLTFELVILVSIRLVVVILTVLIPPKTLRLPDKWTLAAEMVGALILVERKLLMVPVLADKLLVRRCPEVILSVILAPPDTSSV